MSVIKSKRTEAECLFVYNALQLRKFTRDQCLKLPKRRTFYGNTDIAELAKNIASHVIYANDIYPLNREEVQMRRNNLIMAKGYLADLITEITELRDMNLLGENVFMAWNRLIDDEDRLISGVMKKDRERYKNLLKE